MEIYLCGSLGDEIIVTAAVREYARKFPDENIRVYSKWYPDLFVNNPRLGRGSHENGQSIRLWPPAPARWIHTNAHFYGEKLGVRVYDVTPEVFLTKEELRLYPKRDDLVAIDTWAGWPSRRWPIGHFRRLIDLLHERGMRVVEVGKSTPDCYKDTRTPSPSNLDESMVDKQSIRETAALLANCHLYIGNASGMCHLAAAVGTPGVVICSPVVSWYAVSYRTTYAISPMSPLLECEKCFKDESKCHAAEFCLETITPEDVIMMCDAHGLLPRRRLELPGAATGPLDRLSIKIQ